MTPILDADEVGLERLLAGKGAWITLLMRLVAERER
jgi:hypothetical protein